MIRNLFLAVGFYSVASTTGFAALNPLARVEDAGTYECSGKTPEGRDYSETITLDVQNSQLTVQINEPNNILTGYSGSLLVETSKNSDGVTTIQYGVSAQLLPLYFNSLSKDAHFIYRGTVCTKK